MSEAAESRYQTPYGSFNLSRYPARPREQLQAWCAADTLLLHEAYRRGTASEQTLVVNDSHGALCTALQPRALWTDSTTARMALRQNERSNGRCETPVIPSTETPVPGIDLVVLRVPKALPYFEYQLAGLSQSLQAGAAVLAAGMDKHLSPRTAELLESYIGPTQRHRGRNKARMFTAVRHSQAARQVNDMASYPCDPLGINLQGLPNVFSRDKLDAGSHLLLANLRHLSPAASMLDLACGNGVLGLSACKTGLAEKLVFCDESIMAITSAKINAERAFPGLHKDFTFHLGDGLIGYTGEPVELIICNPPFHLDHVVEEFAGRRLLQHCGEHMLPDGRLCVVANRHLKYPALLRRTFHQVDTISANNKFNVYLAQGVRKSS